MYIGKLKFDYPVFLAPMAGYTDSAFRILCSQKGAALVYTEFVSADGIIRKSKKTLDYLNFNEIERPIVMQIFGSDAQIMSEAAIIIENRFNPDLIDINFGCPVRKVIRKGAGSALLKNINSISSIAKQVVKKVNIPVTAKIRSGWDTKSRNAIEASNVLEDCGIAAVTVHARPATHGYNKPADWNIISEVKSAVKIPVIGNGDIYSPEDAKKMLDETRCDAVMIGRGALGNPWIFEKTRDFLATGNYRTIIPRAEQIEMCFNHFMMSAEHNGEEIANRVMKKHLGFYFKGWNRASEIRKQIFNSKTFSNTVSVLKSLMTSIDNNSK